MISNPIEKKILLLMIVSFQLFAFLVIEYLTPDWQKEVRDITREVISAMSEV